MKKIFIAFFLIFNFLVFALEFPSDSKNVKSFCGQKLFLNADDLVTGFENGITFADPLTVQASDFGENIITIEKNDSLNSFPSALCDGIILLHENGFQTVYGNLADVKVFSKTEKFLKSAGLGKTALDKNSNRKPLIFKVIDINEKSKNFVNPLLFLSEISDNNKPQITSVFLQASNGKIIRLMPKTVIESGNYKLFVECFDTINNSKSRLAPFEINSTLNGKSISNISFQTLTVKDGKMLVNNNLNLQNIYQRNGSFFLCEVNLANANSTLKVTVSDYYENVAEVTFEISAF